ncbi:MAG: hypothetical protein AB8G05_16390, partial [Oligoflexales bacterium]
LRAWAPPRSFDFPTIISFLEKLGKFAKDYSALSLTYKGGGVFPIRHYIDLSDRNFKTYLDLLSSFKENLALTYTWYITQRVSKIIYQRLLNTNLI